MTDNDRAEGFRQLAELADRRADSFRHEGLKTHYRSLADGWRRLAEAIEADLKRVLHKNS